jgi:hypothetical protein
MVAASGSEAFLPFDFSLGLSEAISVTLLTAAINKFHAGKTILVLRRNPIHDDRGSFRRSRRRSGGARQAACKSPLM